MDLIFMLTYSGLKGLVVLERFHHFVSRFLFFDVINEDIFLFYVNFRLESEGDFERAAAISVFRVRIRQAIEVLQKGAQLQKGMLL